MRDMGILAHPLADKAFKVHDSDGDAGSVIVWARNYPEARRNGAQALGLEYDDVECERFKQLDDFEGDLLSWMIEDGWYFFCDQCGNACYGGTNLVRRPGDGIFCSVAHAEEHEAYLEKKRSLEAEFLAFAQVKYFGYSVRLAFINVYGDAYLNVQPLNREAGARGGYPGVFIERAELQR